MADVIDLRSARARHLAADRSYTQAELLEIAEGLRRLLASIDADEVTAHAGTATRLEGAIAALEALSRRELPDGLVP
jgi:hypothetical protein